MRYEEFETCAEPQVPTPPSWNPGGGGSLGSGHTYNSHPVPPSGINGAPSYDGGLIKSSFGAEALISVNANPGLGAQPSAGAPTGPAWDECPIKGGL